MPQIFHLYYIVSFFIFLFISILDNVLGAIQYNNRGATLHWGSICVIEGIFTFFQDIWYLYIPFVVMLRDPELGKNFPGKEIVAKFLDEKLHLGRIFNIDGGNTDGNSRHNNLQEEDC